MSQPMSRGAKLYAAVFWLVVLGCGLAYCTGRAPPAPVPPTAVAETPDPPDRLVLDPGERADRPQIPRVKLNPAQQSAWNEGVNYTISDCFQDDKFIRGRCEYDREMLPQEYVNAMSGDYLAQANVSYMLGASPAVEVNAIQSCAWRLVMSREGSPHYNDRDARTLHQSCDPLDRTAASAASARATQLCRLIDHHKVAPIPIPDLEFDPSKPGDMETQ